MQLSEDEWREKLTDKEYKCLRQCGTEMYRCGEFCKIFPKEGYFACKACNFPLYSSASKFEDPGICCCVDLPKTSRSDAAAATWIFRGDESRRRRGRDVDIP